MQKTVVYVLGTSYSGSSLLNSLLDCQPNTRGLGEAVHLCNKPTEAWCSRCECAVEDCRLQAKVNREQFYESVFDAYPDCSTIINSSKHWGQCFRFMPIPPDEYRIALIVLSKSVEEFAHSYYQHECKDYVKSIEMWVNFYQHLFENLDSVVNDSSRTDTQKQLQSRFKQQDIAYATYHELTSATDATIARLTSELELPFNAEYRSRLWKSDTCTVGGNVSIYAQQTANDAFFQASSNYLNGKYAGRQGKIFYDDQWKSNAPLVNEVNEYRNANSQKLRVLETRLRHRNAPSNVTEPKA